MYKLVVLLLFMFPILSGCWDRKEINDIAFVYGTAVDFIDDKYSVMLQVPLPGQMGGAGSEGGGGGTTGGKPWHNTIEEDSSLEKAMSNLQTKSSRELYFAHRRVIVIGRELAERGIISTLDIFVREPENRLSALVVFAEGPGYELLTADVSMESNPAEKIRELAIHMMKEPHSVRDLTHLILAKGIDPSFPVIARFPEADVIEERKNTLGVSGLAVFNEDKVVGILKDDVLNGALLITGSADTIGITIQAPEGEGVLELFFNDVQPKVITTFEGNKLNVKINIKALGGVIGNQSNFNIQKYGNTEKLVKAVEQYMKDKAELALKELQEKYNSDIVGIGQHIYRNHPKEWAKIESTWKEMYPSLNIEVGASFYLEQLGTLQAPLSKKEH